MVAGGDYYFFRAKRGRLFEGGEYLELSNEEKQFALAGNSNYRGKFQWNLDQGKGNLVRVSGEFE